jgi:hypothetical protein
MPDKMSHLIYAVIPPALIYYAGIMYISAYLANFSISIHEVDVSVPLVLSYSLNVFRGPIFVFGLFVAILTSFLMWTSKFSTTTVVEVNRFLNSPFGMPLFLTVIALAIFCLIRSSAINEADKAAKSAWVKSISEVFPRDFEYNDYILTSLGREMMRFCVTNASFQFIFSTKDVNFFMCRKIMSSGSVLILSQQSFGDSGVTIRSIDEKW